MSTGSSKPEPITFDLSPVASSLRREWRTVAITVFVSMALAFGVASLLPRWYRATAVIMPPEQSDLLSNMSFAQRALTKFPIFGILDDYFTPADLYKAILLSRTSQEEIARQFDLRHVYRQKTEEKTLKELKAHYSVKLQPDGTIQVSAEDRDPKRAAAMTNAFLVALDRFNVEKRNGQARRTREFLERRVAETDSLLRASEDALRLYQERHHTVVPPSVSSGDVQAAADLMARKLGLEVRLGVLRNYLREDNDQVVQTRSELDALKSRLSTMPSLQNELSRMVRDLKIFEQLYLLLTAELEQARIRETMDTPTVQVLDPAIPPDRHSRPKRTLVSLLAGAVTFAGALVWVARRGTPAEG